MTVEEENLEAADMNRRSFMGKAGVGVAGFAAAGALLAACGNDDDAPSAEDEEADDGEEAPPEEAPDEEVINLSQDLPELEWEMATSWPTALVTIFGAAQIFSEQVSRLTGGRPEKSWVASRFCPPCVTAV